MANPFQSILFVCTGNICRSPLAEAVLSKLANEAGKKLIVDSAGTTGWHEGDLPDPRSIKIGQINGYDLSNQRARPVCDIDFERFDGVIGLDHSHVSWLKARQNLIKSDHASISCLLDWSQRNKGQDVPDPYYDDFTAFEHALDLIEAGCKGLIARL